MNITQLLLSGGSIQRLRLETLNPRPEIGGGGGLGFRVVLKFGGPGA